MTDTKFHPWSDCATCKHCINRDDKCLAFPEKIPVEIYGNWVKHREVRKDQKGKWIYETAQWAIEAGIKLDRPVRK